MRKYLYKNIVLYQTWGSWDADYIMDGIRFGLTGFCSRTKKEAYKLAKQEVDYLNITRGGVKDGCKDKRDSKKNYRN